MSSSSAGKAKRKRPLRALSRAIKRSFRNYRILSRDYGQWNSIRTRSALDANGDPMPWYTYPALEYLKQFDFRDKTVFEYGAGNSSLFWAARASRVTSVEHQRSWYETVRERAFPNQEIILGESQDEYVHSIKRLGHTFDVIVIDGLHRLECARACGEFLGTGGLIVLDNSDWFPECAAELQKLDLIQVDFSGFGAVNQHTWTTTLFLTRDFRPTLLGPQQPAAPVGSIPMNLRADVLR